MDNLPEVLEEKIFSYLDDCKSNDLNNYNYVCKSWNKKLTKKNCYKIKVFGRYICGYHNEKIIQMIRNFLN